MTSSNPLFFSVDIGLSLNHVVTPFRKKRAYRS
nr:MAG TPA: hypothetical protein [Caudoviricetes sp.]